MTFELSVDLRPKMGPARDQGPRPTCLAHATSSAHEALRSVADYLSPEYLHFFTTGGNVSLGGRFPAVAEALRVEGQPDEGACPYVIPPPPAGWSPPSGLTLNRRESESVGATADQIELAVGAGDVPILGITTTEHLETVTDPWVVSSEGDVDGRHAVACVGVAHVKLGRLFLIRNSWGADWGWNGHAWLSEEFLQRHLEEVLVLRGVA